MSHIHGSAENHRTVALLGVQCAGGGDEHLNFQLGVDFFSQKFYII